MFILFIGLTQVEISLKFSQINNNDFSLFGDAMFVSNNIQLTKPGITSVAAGQDSSGQLIHNLPINTYLTNLSATFTKAKNSNFSGEGFAFFFTPNPLYYQHPPIGRFGLPTSFLAFVFDTCLNVNLDTSAKISLCINNSANPLNTISLFDEYLDITNAHTLYVWIEYNSNNKYFGVFVNKDINMPLKPMLFETMDLSEFFTKHSTLYVGFSAYSIRHNAIYAIAS
jgi:hypothetical protein